MHVLVTGANGFVGAMLCRKLSEQRHKVRGMVRKTSDLSLLEGVKMERCLGSLEDRESLAKACEGAQVVFHAASAVSDWGTIVSFRKAIVDGTQNLLEAALRAGVKRFVYVSSVAVHSFIDAQDMTEESPQLPIPFPYGRVKREAEDLVMRYHDLKGMEIVIVRPGDVYGPGDRVTLLKMAKRLERGKMMLMDQGRTLGAFTYVENLADGLILAGTKTAASGETFVITDGVKMSWAEYFKKLTKALGVPPVTASVSSGMASAAAVILEFLYGLLRVSQRPLVTRFLAAHIKGDFHFSIDKARRLLGYEPAVGVDQAVRRTAEWYIGVVRGGGSSE